MTRVVITQSNYVPWRGYFRTMGDVDVFVLYDEVQYTRRDWRNRNRIMTDDGAAWLTIPVRVGGRFEQRIDETLVADPEWRRSHWSRLRQVYRDAPGFVAHGDEVEHFYSSIETDRLSEINRAALEMVRGLFGITTPMRSSTEFPRSSDDRTDRLVEICRALAATTYVSGPAAQAYLDVSRFRAAGIDVEWADYDGLPEYSQPGDTFEPHVSVLDALFRVGADPGLILP